jgi:hypothetical protein
VCVSRRERRYDNPTRMEEAVLRPALEAVAEEAVLHTAGEDDEVVRGMIKSDDTRAVSFGSSVSGLPHHHPWRRRNSQENFSL